MAISHPAVHAAQHHDKQPSLIETATYIALRDDYHIQMKLEWSEMMGMHERRECALSAQKIALWCALRLSGSGAVMRLWSACDGGIASGTPRMR